MSAPIRVVIADDQRLLRESLRLVLDAQSDIEVVGVVGDGAQAAQLAAEAHADVVLMDLRMPGVDGVEGTRAVRQAWPQAAVLVFTTFEDDEGARRALQAGAMGYVLKDLLPEDLAHAIRMVARGHALITPGLASRLANAVPAAERAVAGADGEALTAREREILALVAEGLSNRDIAQRLFITEGTVKNHLSHLFQKMSARRRTEALRLAREQGMLDGHDGSHDEQA